MTPVLQTAVTGLVWAVSVSLVIIVSSFCAQWYMKVVDDRNAIEVEKEKEAMASRNKVNVAYICDTEQDCNVSERCVLNGGTCSHTTDIGHAANFELLCPEVYFKEKFYVEREVKEDISNDTAKSA